MFYRSFRTMTTPLLSCGEFLGGWIQLQASGPGMYYDRITLKIPESNDWITAITVE